MIENTHLGYSAFSPGHKDTQSPVHLFFRAGQKGMADTLVLSNSVA